MNSWQLTIVLHNSIWAAMYISKQSLFVSRVENQDWRLVLGRDDRREGFSENEGSGWILRSI